MHSLVKQRRDSIEQFTNGGRQDLADKEAAEILVLEAYLPPAADPAAIERAVADAIAETGATSAKDMGRVMKAAMAKLAGQSVDGKTVNELVRRKLADPRGAVVRPPSTAPPFRRRIVCSVSRRAASERIGLVRDLASQIRRYQSPVTEVAASWGASD